MIQHFGARKNDRNHGFRRAVGVQPGFGVTRCFDRQVVVFPLGLEQGDLVSLRVLTSRPVSIGLEEMVPFGGSQPPSLFTATCFLHPNS